MSEVTEEIIKNFGNRLRIRVCGICVRDNALLVLKHHNIGSVGHIWIPPGGGLQFGERMSDALVREFMEETGLQIEVKKLVYVNEYLESPLHAIELFFTVNATGEANLGHDPEMPENISLLQELIWMSREALEKENPAALHPVVDLWLKNGLNEDKSLLWN